MTIGETLAIKKAAEVIEAKYPVSSEGYEVTGTYNDSGRWRITFDVDGISSSPRVRLDDETGNLAAEEGHSYTSELPDY